MAAAPKTKGVLTATVCVAITLAATGHAATLPETGTVDIAADRRRTEFLTRSSSIYSVQPDIPNCRAGELLEGEKKSALDTLNNIRKLHGLGPVTYDDTFDREMMQAALMMAANRDLSHSPPRSWKCYTPGGARMAGMSNIEGGVASPYLLYTTAQDNIVGWVTDVRNRGAGVGHRRWLLDPFLKTISFGKVSGAFDAQSVTEASLVKVIGSDSRTTGLSSDALVSPSNPKIVAYPQGDYPVRYYEDGAHLSVSLLTNPSDVHLNGADFSRASIIVKTRDGEAVPVGQAHGDNLFYGLPNNIRFSTGILKRNVIYDVSITGVVVAGKAVEVSYWFRLVP